MIKYFCDFCEKEITKENKVEGGFNTAGRLGTTLEKKGLSLKVEILTSSNETSNVGCFCKHCILDALYKLDDRPKQAPYADKRML